MSNGNIIKFGEVVDINFKDNDPENIYRIKLKLYDFETLSTGDLISALPYSNNTIHIPLIGEIVSIQRAPCATAAANTKIFKYYYSQPISIHNNNHCNVLPKLSKVTIRGGSMDYADQQDGVSSTTSTKPFKPGIGFKENKDIKNLQLYEGDYIIDGRWGNSIRFGSTITAGDYSVQPTWKESGNAPNGSPIIIIRNGQIESPPSGMNNFIVEDVNEDKSSIYITSGQLIPLKPTSDIFDSYDSKPTSFKNYDEEQVIINSNRIVLSAKKDSVFLNSNKSISISTNGLINLDSAKKYVANCPEMYFGGKEATEPLLFGNKSDDWLNELLDILDDILLKLSTHIHPTGVGPSGPPMPPELLDFSTQIPLDVTTIRKKIVELKSKRNFTL